ncbi:MAG: hypothetical protein KGZ81_08790 [Flavobacteriales bacterium]|jgi:hypothetical protein|nr:hypothetical protein [Flavobacteriales bacterium]
MKVRYLIILILFAGFSTTLFAQRSIEMPNDSSGFYLTYNDYVNGKITNGFPNYKKGYTLWPKGFFINKDPELKTPDTSIVHKRADIWGYTDHRGQFIRIFKEKHYKVLCDKGIIIYIIYSPTRTSYHFSKTLNDPIYHLTRKNLTNNYADNSEFLKKIYSTKKNTWLIWDDKKERYFLNKLFLE